MDSDHLAACDPVEARSNPAPGRAVGYSDDGEFARKRTYAIADVAFGFRIESARHLIEDEKLRPRNNRTCKGQALPLASGEFRAHFAHIALKTVRKLTDEVGGTRESESLPDPFRADRRVAKGDVSMTEVWRRPIPGGHNRSCAAIPKEISVRSISSTRMRPEEGR